MNNMSISTILFDLVIYYLFSVSIEVSWECIWVVALISHHVHDSFSTMFFLLITCANFWRLGNALYYDWVWLLCRCSFNLIVGAILRAALFGCGRLSLGHKWELAEYNFVILIHGFSGLNGSLTDRALHHGGLMPYESHANLDDTALAIGSHCIDREDIYCIKSFTIGNISGHICAMDFDAGFTVFNNSVSFNSWCLFYKSAVYFENSIYVTHLMHRHTIIALLIFAGFSPCFTCDFFSFLGFEEFGESLSCIISNKSIEETLNRETNLVIKNFLTFLFV